jgi:hypothetical protein
VRSPAAKQRRADATQFLRILVRQGGVDYVIINSGGSRDNICRFAREIMPAFSDEPAFALAGK